MKKLRSVLRNSLVVLGIETTAFFVGLLIQSFVHMAGVVSMTFVLAPFLVAVITDGYVYGVVASLLTTLLVNWAFTYPHFMVDFTIYDNIISAVCMLTVTIITSMQTTKLKRQKQLEAENEMERARTNLLRAVSHDLRTPLTSIYGACSAVSGNYDALTREQHIKLLSQAQEDAQWLIRMVENLLTVTRMSMDSGVKIKKFPVVLEELVDGVLTKFRNHHPDVLVKVDIPDEFIRIPMDAMLIEQVLINLLENAVQHASGMTKIELRVRVADDMAIFVVTDDGCGIRQDVMRHMFTDFVKNENLAANDKSRSMGIGLSVCATIVRAHGGRITAENIPTGGAMFRFILPVGEDKDEQ